MEWQQAAERGDSAALQSLLDASVDVNTLVEAETGFTPLHYASKEGRLTTVKLLIERNLARDAVDRFGRTPLYLAVLNRHVETARLLLKAGADANLCCQCGTSCISKAAEQGDKAILTALVKAGAVWNTSNADGETPKQLANRNGFEILWDSYEKRHRDSLRRAAASGDAELTRKLVHLGVNPSETSALEAACGSGNIDVVRFLLYDPMPSSPCPASPQERVSSMGVTALHEAAKKGHTDITRLLLSTGLSADTRDHDNMTALHRAAARGHVGVAGVLLEWDTSGVDSRGVNGVTPLHQAAMQGQGGMVRFLLENGANPSLEDGQRRTPKDRARGDALRMFEEWGL